jgi:hypothetical protein
MRNVAKTPKALIFCAVSMLVFISFGFAQQTVLFTESFESALIPPGTIPPTGWELEQVTGTIPGVYFVTSSVLPTIDAAYDGMNFVQYNSYDISIGSTRLKRTTALSTADKSFIMVDFAWHEDPGFTTSVDRVEVQWSTNGTSWNTAATFSRYNAVAGWKVKNVVLPNAANNQAILYVAFLFTSAYGNNCAIDMVNVTCGPAAPSSFVTIGTGADACVYPYNTYWMDSRSQFLYAADELTAAGMAAGSVQSVGLQVSAPGSPPMNNFVIRMMNSSLTSLDAEAPGATQVYSNPAYAPAGTGWQNLTLTSPFEWDGMSNVILEYCFDNSEYSASSSVNGSTVPDGLVQYWEYDILSGTMCETAAAFTRLTPAIRPNVQFGIPPMNPAVLMGYVKDVNSMAPIAGAIVRIGSAADTSRANGFYVIYNLTAGQVVANTTAAGYLGRSDTATVVTGVATGLDIHLSPGPAVEGTVTDASTGAPVVGATVTVGTGADAVTTLTVTGGSYLTPLLSVSGPQPVVIGMTGYDDFTGTITLVAGTTVTLDTALLPTAYQPGPFIAALNSPATFVNLNWGVPQGQYQVISDDGIQDDFAIWASAGNLNAVKITPQGWPAKLIGGKVNLGAAYDYPPDAPPLSRFMMLACKADGPDGMPGTMIDSVEVTPAGFGWATFSFPLPVIINSGDFYLVMKQGGTPPHAAGVGVDLTNTQLRSYSRFVAGGAPWMPADGNFMMRAIMEGDVAIPPAYHVWRMLQGQENNPAMWTSIYLGSANSTADYSWASLPCETYRWAVHAIYSLPGQPWSAATFSNVLGRCSADVHVCVNLTCAANPKTGTLVKLVSTAYPDTSYTLTTDTSGCVHFNHVWYGSYQLQVTRFSYLMYDQNVLIHGDVSIPVILLQNAAPATNCTVNEQSLLVTWNVPKIEVPLLDEPFADWTTNAWEHEGANWVIGGVRGNPAPDAEFFWSPAVTGYNASITSKAFSGVGSAGLMLNFDLLYSDYGGGELIGLTVEISDGGQWQIVEEFTAAGGDIPWTNYTYDISGYTGKTFKIRFRSWGDNSYYMNWWDIDNVKLLATEDATPCIIAYNVYLNNTLDGVTTDTSYVIPGSHVTYGSNYEACVKAVYGSGYSAACCDYFTSVFLCPPDTLAGSGIENAAYLTWERPDCGGGKSTSCQHTQVLPVQPDPASSLAAVSLLGYKVYRNGNEVAYINDPDTVEYYDVNLDPGIYSYTVKGYYDVSPIAPGNDHSLPAGPVEVAICYGRILPFYEPWDQGSFAFNDWDHSGNWSINAGVGNPAPAADFSWQPPETNYNDTLTSVSLNAVPYTCARIYLDFDYKLLDRDQTGTEYLTVEEYVDGNYQQVAEYSNTGDISWTNQHFELNSTKGKAFKVRFRAHGVNSLNMLRWCVDNIRVYAVCISPSDLTFAESNNTVSLSWTEPDCANKQMYMTQREDGSSPRGISSPAGSLSGYNVWRTDSTGLEPYARLNGLPVTETAFTDVLPLTGIGNYRYYVTAVFNDTITGAFLCESPGSDTVTVLFPATGVTEPANRVIVISPNPASEFVNIMSDYGISGIDVMNFAGQTVYSARKMNSKTAKLNVAAFKTGVYFVKVSTGEAVRTVKITVSH